MGIKLFCQCVALFDQVGHFVGMNKKNDQAYKLLVRVLKKVGFLIYLDSL